MRIKLRFPLLILLAMLSLLVACGAAPTDLARPDEEIGAGGISPEAVVESFFDSLDQALKDPALAQPSRRDYWVERLAGYFDPRERDAQREALDTALFNFVAGLGQLEPGQTLTLELRFERIEKISDDGERALVQPVNATIYLLIARSTDRGPVAEYEQQIGLAAIVGRDDGAVPTVKLGDRWFLTEG